MTAAVWFTLGAIAALALERIAAVICSGKSTGPDPERRTRAADRRRRFKAAKHVDDIADQYGAEALTYPQAMQRLRSLEVPADIAKRVLTIHN